MSRDQDENDSPSTLPSIVTNSTIESLVHTASPSNPPPSPSERAAQQAVAVPPCPQSSLLSSTKTTSKARSLAHAPNHYAPSTGAVCISIDMRTRSSRLFFVLLHLVGVSTNVPLDRSTPCKDHRTRQSGHHAASNLFAFLRRHQPSWLSWSVGIVGVHPTAIQLERLDIQSSRRGLKGLVERVQRVWGWDSEDLLGEPYWFQDNVDGQCLGPGGVFGDCGDATLWRVKRKPLTKRQLREKRYEAKHNRRMLSKIKKVDSQQNQRINEPNVERGSSASSVCVWPFFCAEDSQVLPPAETDYDEVYGFEYESSDDHEGFSIQLLDTDTMMNLREGSNRRRRKKSLFWRFNNEGNSGKHAECLLSLPSEDSAMSMLQIGSCSSEAAWVWHVNRDGILVRGATRAERRRKKRRWRIPPLRTSAGASASGASGRLQHHPQSDFGCVYRANSTLAVLLSCEGKQHHEKQQAASLVGFSLVRYPSTLLRSAPLKSSSGDNDALMWNPWTILEGPFSADAQNNDNSVIKSQVTKDTNLPEQHLPISHTSSHNHASAGAKDRKKVDVKSTARMLHTSLEQVGKAKKGTMTSASHIRDAHVTMNGAAFHDQLMNIAGIERERRERPSSARLRTKKLKDGRNARVIGQTRIHENHANAWEGDHHGQYSNPHRPRKIPIHPYIQSSNGFVWVDPLTSLEYPTDLCGYLGHTKKEAGRHTLMGVGQYYRTAFNIKVYGAALYVAKRDVLADPKFGEYAALSSEDLRRRNDFYDHLMNMPSSGEDPAKAAGGFFDRTLFIKTNMQLSLDAMRKSLEADWSLLTEEMKSMIIESSFKERLADERMQKKVQSKENSSNCSCGQLALQELNADRSCCARGTELVFTWRKSGDLEIRLDGRVMDIFPRADIAKGIFSEYLNDNPISLDAKSHFADGFPFLLAPLAQVKGMSSAVPNQTHEPTKRLKSSSSHNPMHRLIMHSMGAMNNQAHTISKWMQESAAEMSTSALGGALGVARGLSEELDRQRMDLLESAVALQKEGMGMLSSLIRASSEEDGLALTIVNQAVPSLFDTYNENIDLESLPQEIIPDEIGITIEPNMSFTHRLFFTTVHVYLILLFVVSLPGSYTTRLVVKRRILETKKYVESKSHDPFMLMKN